MPVNYKKAVPMKQEGDGYTCPVTITTHDYFKKKKKHYQALIDQNAYDLLSKDRGKKSLKGRDFIAMIQGKPHQVWNAHPKVGTGMKRIIASSVEEINNASQS